MNKEMQNGVKIVGIIMLKIVMDFVILQYNVKL